MRALGYVWRVLVNAFYVAVVLYVLAHLQEHPETLIIPVLGLIYARIHMLGIGLGVAVIEQAKLLSEVREWVKHQIFGSDYIADKDAQDARSALSSKTIANMVIDSVGTGIVSFLCLWKLFASLP